MLPSAIDFDFSKLLFGSDGCYFYYFFFIVIDVYQEWCGPCTAMAGHLKEIKLQLGDDLLHCALVMI